MNDNKCEILNQLRIDNTEWMSFALNIPRCDANGLIKAIPRETLSHSPTKANLMFFILTGVIMLEGNPMDEMEMRERPIVKHESGSAAM